MIEYRQYVPADAGAEFDARIERDVREHLSRCVEPHDDERALADEVTISRRDSRQGGHWVHGSIDRDPTPLATAEEPNDELPTALVREPTDMQPTEYAAHLAVKAAR